MKMIQTYQGYFQKGRFISPELISIPDNVEADVMITGKKCLSAKTKSQRKLDAFNKFVSAVESIDDEKLTNEDFDDLENNRANFDREVEPIVL